MSISFRSALPSDGDGVLNLLDEGGLTRKGVFEDADRILVAAGLDGIVACAALEMDRDAGLLRSVAVAPAARMRGVGTQVVAAMEREARNLGVRNLYLLTTTAEPFFRRLGYRVVDRNQVPEVVRQSAEFSDCASVNATAMLKVLS